MKKPLKITLISLAAIVGLLILVVIALPLIVDPNRYRDDVVHAVKERTGRDLKIEGKLSWSILPRLAIEANKLELANASGFGKDPFVRIERAGAQVAVWPLFAGRVQVETIYLDGLMVNLAKNAAGQSNWDDLAKPAERKPAKPAAAETPAAGGAAAAEAVAINRLDIRNVSLAYRDDQAGGGAFAVNNLSLTTGRIEADKPFDLRLTLEFVRDHDAPITLAIDGRITAGVDALSLGDLKLQLDDSKLTGLLEIKNFARPSLRFDLALDQLDLDRYLPKPPAKPATPASAAAGGGELPVALVRDLDLDGKFRAGQLKVMNLRLTDAQILVRAKDGTVRLGPNSAKAYGGLYRGEARVDVRGKALAIQADENLKGVALDALLKDAIGLDKFRGTANLELKVTGLGGDVGALKRSLNGTSAFGVQNGVIVGVDFKKFNDTLDTAIKSKSTDKLGELKPQPGDQTPFTNLGGTAKIVNGVLQNDDLKIDAPGLVAVSGRGSADLGRDALDYTVQLGRLPLRIVGPFSSLSFKPDFKAVAKEQAAGKIDEKKESAKQKLKDKLKR